MGLLDILNGMQNGPRGNSTSTAASSSSMSPVTIALMGLLAYKAIKQLSPGQSNTATTSPNEPASANPSAGGLGGMLSGGLGGLFQGPLGSLLAGGAAGSVLSGGLSDLLKQFQQGGQGDVAHSWVGAGPNKGISPDDLSKVLSEDQIKTLMARSGMSRDELIASLSEHLPEVINQLTPNGHLPTEHEASRLI